MIADLVARGAYGWGGFRAGRHAPEAASVGGEASAGDVEGHEGQQAPMGCLGLYESAERLEFTLLRQVRRRATLLSESPCIYPHGILMIGKFAT